MSAAPRRILVICLRRLGDVLLATPLIRSLKRTWPDAQIDALVFADTAAMLEGNPDLARIIRWPRRGRRGEALRLGWGLLRRYDRAAAVTASDRALALAMLAARRRAGLVQDTGLHRWLMPDAEMTDSRRQHMVTQALTLARRLGAQAVPEVIAPHAADVAAIESALGADWATRRYAVVHAVPMYRYKAWTEPGWVALIGALRARGLEVVLSGGPGEAERALVARLHAAAGGDPGVVDLAGRLSLGALARLLAAARVYVGPDTAVTHLAAVATPTVALFGPSSPVAWGPWPQGWSGGDSPWRLTAPSQRAGHVVIVQGSEGRREGCIPCLLEGCERRLDSPSDCLDRLPVARVLEAVDQLLGATPGAGRAPAKPN